MRLIFTKGAAILLFLTLPFFLSKAQSPLVSSFSPASGPVGSLITINGNNLADPTALSIGGVPALVISSSASSVTAFVMPGTVSGPIGITSAAGSSNSGTSFTISSAAAISTQAGDKKTAKGNSGKPFLGLQVAVSADGNTAAAGGTTDNNDAGSVWIFTKVNGFWTQQGPKLEGFNGSGASSFGLSLALSADGNTVAIGGPADGYGAGAVWVYTRSGSAWSPQGIKLVPTNPSGFGTLFGSSVSLSADGNTLLASGTGDDSGKGAAWVFSRIDGVWSQQSKIVPAGLTAGTKAGFSSTISADGSTFAISSPYDADSSGAVWVYTGSGASWSPQGGKISVSSPTLTAKARLGSALSLSANGHTLMAGAATNNLDQGCALIFTRSGSVWTQQAKLFGSGALNAARQGSSVSLSADGNRAALGAYQDGFGQGSAWVFSRSGSTWTQQAKFTGSGASGTSAQGLSLSLSADAQTLTIGGPNDNTEKGAVWFFGPLPAAPELSSFTPSTASDGIEIVIEGNNFTGAMAVSFGGVAAQEFTVLSGTRIRAMVSNGASGSVSVTTSGGTGSKAGFVYSFSPQPTITSVSPLSGPVGALVGLKGTNLLNPVGFTIGGVPALIISNTSTRITAMVMPGAVTGAISLNNGSGTASGGTFSISAPGTIADQQGDKLPGFNLPLNAQAGTSVAISADGNTAVAGVPYDEGGKGYALVFVREGSVWALQEKLQGVGSSNALQGMAVAISADGNTVAVGGPKDNNSTGAVWIFTRSGEDWTQQGGKITGTSYNGQAAMGSSVALSADGNLLAFGGPGDNTGEGAVWLYSRSAGVWSLAVPKLISSFNIGPAQLGNSLGLSADGKYLIAGGSQDEDAEGSAWVFAKSGSSWAYQARLRGSGSSFAEQGKSVAISADGKTALIGGNVNEEGKGNVWVFTRSGSSWTQQGSALRGNDAVGPAFQGQSVALSADGNTAAIGGDNDAGNLGGVWIFRRSGGNWNQDGPKLFIDGRSGNAAAGYALALSADGQTLLSGGPKDNINRGAVWVHSRPSGPPQISGFSPNEGPVGTVITINGSNFSGVSKVRIGGQAAASFSIIDANTIQATLGSGNSGFVRLQNSLGADSLGQFDFQRQPIISSFTPLSAASGSTVTISGSNFTDANYVSFGGIPASSFTVVSATEITAVVAGGASGAISVTSPAGTGNLAGFTFIPPPVAVVSSFSPLSGTIGDTITISGSNFTGVTAVSFGGTPAAYFKVINGSTIKAVLAAGTSGAVSVSNQGGTGSLAGFTFVFPSTPLITSITPASGSVGASITIIGNGNGFNGVTAVTFGGTAAASFTVVNANTITAVVAGGSSGAVSVTNPAGTGSRPGFTFIPPPSPVITSFTPTSATPGSIITISGSNFAASSSVSFGGTAAASFTVVNGNTITAMVAAGASGQVSVSTPGGTGSLAGFTLTPTTSPVIFSFTPISGCPGTAITITGLNLSGTTAVSIGGTAVSSFTVNSATQITATAGSGGSGTIQLSTAAGTASSNTSFTMNPLPGRPGSITGTSTVCQGQNGVSYNVPAIANATGYNWTLPSGASIVSGNNTNNITVNYSSTASAGNITVAGTNGCGSTNASPGRNDPTFNSTDLGFGTGDGADNTVGASAIQPDGKILISGGFYFFNNLQRNYFTRLNSDGTLDAGFGPPSTGPNNPVSSISLQSDGKVIIGGSFTVFSISPFDVVNRNCIARLNSDGTLDAAFNPGTGANADIFTTALQPDGKIIIGGAFTTYNGIARNYIARLNSDGSLDASFNPGTGASGSVNDIALQPDGKIIIGGFFTTYNGTARSRIARLNANGSLDATFNPGTGASGLVNDIALQPDGKIIIGGFFTTYNSTTRNNIARLNSNGSLDTGFPLSGTGANDAVRTTTLQPDGKVIIGGNFTSYNGTTRNRIVRLNADGSLDATFNPGTGANDISVVITTNVQTDGKIIIGGNFTSYNGTARNRIARLNANGGLDASFNPGTGANSTIQISVLQPDSKIIIGGDFTAYNGTVTNSIARLNADGILDAGFNSGTGANSTVWSTLLQPDGKVILGGWFTSYNGTARSRIARLNSNGSLDASFNPGTGPNSFVQTTALQSDGKIIVCGSFTSYNGIGRNSVARINADGTLDATFNPGTGIGGTFTNVFGVSIQSDGKIIIAGAFASYNGTVRNNIARLNTNGSLDATFSPGTGTDGSISAIALQPDGKIIIGGSFTSYNSIVRNNIARLNADGTLDATFNPGTGTNSTVTTILHQTDGKIIIGGGFTSFNGTGRNRIARIIGSGFPVTVNPLPSSAGSITGTASVTAGQNAIAYSVPAMANATGYNWILPAGASIASGSNTNSITVNFSTSAVSGNISVAGTNACGSGVATSFAVSVTPLTPVVSSFSPVSAYSGTTITITGSNFTTATAVSFGGTPAASFVVVNGNIITAIVTTGATGNVSVTNPAGTGTRAGFTFLSAPAPAIFSFSPTSGCPGSAVITITGSNFTGATAVSIGGTPVSSFTVNSATQITATAGNGGSGSVLVSTPSGMAISASAFIMSPLPLADGSITGISTVCQGQTAVSYGVTPIANATGYNWTLPPGASIVSGNNTSSITVNYSSTASSGNLRVQGSNACGNGAFSGEPGTLDAKFNSGDIGFGAGEGSNGTIEALALQPDGKILIGGLFFSHNGTERNRIARLNADGTLDASFNPGTGATGFVRALALQPDGKILIGGLFFSYNGTARSRIARLNADGTLDATFNPGSGLNSGSVIAFALQPDGKILIGGDFTSYNGTARNNIARLNSDGTLDASFNPVTGANIEVDAITLQPDGKILIGGCFTSYNGTARNRIARLNANGSLDASFNPGTGVNGGCVSAVSLQPDGKVLIVGSFTSYNGTARNRIARLNANGLLDASFNPGTGANNDVRTISLQPDGKILIGGAFTSYNGTARNYLARLNADGSLDATFNPGTGANGFVYALALQPAGKVLIGGDFSSYNGTARSRIARLNVDAVLDASFNPGFGANGTVLALAQQADGKILIGGAFTSYNGTARNRVARLNADGMLDASFNPGTGANLDVVALVLQPDGKILIGGTFNSYNGTVRNNIARLNTDGTLDASFNPGSGVNGGSVLAFALQTDGKILIGGFFTSYNGTARNYIARLNSDGTLDASFNPGTGADGDVFALALQPDGKILIGGNFTSYNGTARNFIARLNANGTLDASFNPGIGANNPVYALALQPDGKILIGGEFSSYNGTARNYVARLNAGGTLDASFNPGTGPNNFVRALSLQPDGKVIIGGDFTSFNGSSGNCIARLNANGTLDATFNPGTGANAAVYAFALQPDEKILIGGDFTSYNGVGRNQVARLFGSGFSLVTVNPLPGSAGSIGGAAAVTPGQNAVSYSVPAIADATGYLWTVPPGASIASGSNTNSITVNYSANAVSGDVSVSGINSCGSGVSASFAITVNPLLPVVSTFTPASGLAGNSITITGSNFSGATQVLFGGTEAASFTVVNSGTIIATLAFGSSGSVSVSNYAGTGSKAGFTYISGPSIGSFSPVSAANGATVTITGSNFSGATTVSFGGTAAASFTVVNATTITATVAAGSSGNVSVTTPGGTGSKGGFNFIPVPVVSNFTPASGPSGTLVNISGSGFTGTTAVSFGGTAASSFSVINDLSIQAEVGTGASGSVSVSTPGGTGSKAGFTFTFTPAPVITSFTPTTASNGNLLTISGSNFTGATEVLIGGTPVLSYTVVSSSTISATVSYGASGSVTVTTPGGTASLAGFIIESMPVPVITSFSPVMAVSGTTVTITGSNFTGLTSVTFGGTAAASFTLVNSSTITAVVGPGSSGLLRIKAQGGTAGLAGFTYIPKPEIASFSPVQAGPGLPVTIKGRFFNTSSAVQFGATAAGSFTVLNDSTVLAIVGTGSSGSIIIQTLGGSDTLSGFSFVAPPSITSFTPLTAASGATVTITGSNFSGATAVRFGGTGAASFTVVDANTITAVVGSGASGSVKVSTPGGADSLAGFTFIPAPVITSFTPVQAGPGMQITITGSNFSNASTVSFGGTAAASFTIVDATTITAVLGSGASGSLSLSTPGGTGSLAGFTFIPAPVITSFTPLSAASGATVTITGSNFSGGTAINFGGTAASSFIVINATTITAVVGNGASGSVKVSTPGGADSLAGFTFIPAPVITSFSPASAAPGETVTIRGIHFTNASSVSFGNISATSFTLQGDTLINALVGGGASGLVTVTTPGGTSSLAGFTWLSQPLINTWTGTGNWNTASNWSFGTVPQGIDKARVFSGIVQVDADVQVRCLYTVEGTQVNIQAGKSLAVSDTVYFGGEITGPGYLAVTGAQPVLMQQPSAWLQNLRVEATGPANILTPFRLRGTLKLWSALATNDDLMLESGLGYQARIGKIETGGDLIGQVNWQRHIPGPAAWHFIGTPIQGQSLTGWTDDFPVGNSSYFSHNEGGTISSGNQVNGWENSGTGGVVGKGYRVFLGNVFLSNNPRFDNIGTITKGDFSFPLSFTPSGYGGGGWNFLSNPYPCEISWSDFSRSAEVDAAIYIYNKTAYGAYSAGSGIGVNGVGNYIAQGQGFFVKLSGPGGSLLATENAKPATDMSQAFLRTAVSAYPVMKFTLSDATGQGDELALSDRPDAGSGYDAQLDALKFDATMALSARGSDGRQLSIQCLKLDSLQATVIPLKIRVPAAGQYQFSGLAEQGALQATIYLRDLQAQTLTILPQNGSIPLNLDAGSWENRFELVLLPDQATDAGEISGSRGVHLFPSPAGSWLMVEGENISGIRILNVLGQAMALPTVQKQERGWLLPDLDLPPGIYRTEIRHGDKVQFLPFVKE